MYMSMSLIMYIWNCSTLLSACALLSYTGAMPALVYTQYAFSCFSALEPTCTAINTRAFMPAAEHVGMRVNDALHFQRSVSP